MPKKILKSLAFPFFLLLVVSTVTGDPRSNIYRLGVDLERMADQLAQSNYDHFRGWNAEFSDLEQSVLFRSEAFVASCRLFLCLAEERSEYLKSGYVRTNLFQAFVYLNRSFQELEAAMRDV